MPATREQHRLYLRQWRARKGIKAAYYLTPPTIWKELARKPWR